MDANGAILDSYQARCKVEVRKRNLMLHWASSEGWLASRGYEVWHSDDSGVSWDKRDTLKTGWASWLSRHPFFAQVGRLGIHNLIRLSSGTLLAIADSVVFRSTDEGAAFHPAFSGFQGRRPLRSAICQDHFGRIYLGEYRANSERGPIRLWRSDDDGVTWSPVHTWPAGEIRHIHFVQFDPYEKAIWVGTGDRDCECRIAYSQDGGVSLEAIGGGTQVWRAVSVLFTPETILWGTDIGSGNGDQPNHIVQWDRSRQALDRLTQIDGPAYYSTKTVEGIFVVGTAVERGENERDDYVHLYWSKDHHTWHNIRLSRRWPLPGLCGPATITFPSSDGPLSRLVFNANLVLSRYNGSLFEAIPECP